MSGPPKGLGDATKALEALLLKQLLASSGAFRGSEAAGSALQSGMFAEALADAVAAQGGLGLEGGLVASLTPGGAPDRAAPPALGPLPERPPAPDRALHAVLTSPFGARRDPFTGEAAFHAGVDLAAPEGTPIPALKGGVVRYAGERGGYGLMVEIDHGDGTVSRYGHASALLVRPGDRVAEGEAIARIGETGRATGPHLHLEVRQGGRPVDPTRALKSYGLGVDDTSAGTP